MAGLVHSLLALAIIVIGIGVMIGRISLSEALKKILFATVGLLLASALVVNAGNAWASLSDIERGTVTAAILLAVPVGFGTAILRSDFGRKVLASVLGDWIYDRYQEGEGCCGSYVLLLLLLLVLTALLFG